MLRPWREQVVAYLAPQRVALMRVRNGIRPRVLASQSCAVDNGHAGNPAPAFSCLSEMLTDSQFQDASARVIVADPWVRFALVPAPAIRLDADGRLSHARYVLADLYGDGLTDWTVTLTDAPPGRAYLACAMPSPLRTELEDVLLAAHLQLTSLQPQLVVAFNAWRRQLPADAGWFVSLDDASMTAVQLRDGEWQRVHMARLSSQWSVELQRLRALGRYTDSTGGDGRLYVDAPFSLRSAGREEMPDLTWLEPDAKLEASPELALLQRVAA